MRNVSRLGSRLKRSSLAVLIALLGLCAVALAQVKPEVHNDDENIPDAEKPWQESAANLPPYPDLNATRSFYVSPATTLDFAIDPASLSVGKDEVIRYTLVIKSSSGAANVSFEGLRCSTEEYKVYAYGYVRNKKWSPVKNPQWKPVTEVGANRPHAALIGEYFCAQSTRVSDDPKVLLKRLSDTQFQLRRR